MSIAQAQPRYGERCGYCGWLLDWREPAWEPVVGKYHAECYDEMMSLKRALDIQAEDEARTARDDDAELHG